jgi:hypothetical protein
MTRDYKDRMDPGGEIDALTKGIQALSHGPVGWLLKHAGALDEEALDLARTAHSQYDELIQLPSEVAVNLAPLGWIAFGTAPAEEYREASRLAARGEGEAAEALLTKTWNDDDRLSWAITRIKSLYSGNESIRAIGHQRWKQLAEALENHRHERYASAICIVLPQIDGIVHDLTGQAAKSFFASGAKAKHLHDDETIAGHPDGLAVLARLFNKDRRSTTVEGELRRHGILHGRELGYDTLRNSTKVFVALLSVIEWAQPLAVAKAKVLIREEEERHAGSKARDEFGRRLDRRGFEEAQNTLMKLAQYQFGHFKRRGAYETRLEDLDKPEGLPAVEGLVLDTSADRQRYRAWMTTETGVVFGIAGTEGSFEGWKYVGESVPPPDVLGSGSWRHDIEDMPHDDW